MCTFSYAHYTPVLADICIPVYDCLCAANNALKTVITSWGMQQFVAKWSRPRELYHRYAQTDSRLFSLSVRDSKGSGQTQAKIHLKRGAQEEKRAHCRTEHCRG